jgi:hypothetical protein
MASRTSSDKPNHIIEDQDEDDALTFLDGLDDNDKSSSTRSRPKRQRPAAPATTQPPVSSTSMTKKDEGIHRIQYYRALQGFLQAIRESGPLYQGERLRHPELDDQALRARIGAACNDHLALVDLCLKVNNADAADIMLRYQRRSLATALANLYRHAPISEVRGLVEVAQQWMLSSTDFENASADYNSPDNLLAVRMTLFTAALRTQLNLESMWCSFTAAEVIQELQQIAVSLANELAYNWSVRSEISDKENLFQTSLPHCLEIVETAYKEIVLKELPPIEYLYTDTALKLPRFEDAVDDMDVGYEDEDREALFTRARAMVLGLFPKLRPPTLPLNDTCRWFSAYIAEIDRLLARSWNDAATAFMTEVHAMTPSQRAKYVEENHLMDANRCFDRFMDQLDEIEAPLADVEIDFSKVADRAKRHLAWLWAISDSLIVARKECVREEFT